MILYKVDTVDLIILYIGKRKLFDMITFFLVLGDIKVWARQKYIWNSSTYSYVRNNHHIITTLQIVCTIVYTYVLQYNKIYTYSHTICLKLNFRLYAEEPLCAHIPKQCATKHTSHWAANKSNNQWILYRALVYTYWQFHLTGPFR